MTVAHQMKGQLILGSKFLKKHFQAGSRMTKRELAQKILDGTIPGWVEGETENGTPWVDEESWLNSWGPLAPSTGQKTSVADMWS